MILRVFPRRTSHTPADDRVRIGLPMGPEPVEPDEVHVSCTFTWDLAEAEELGYSWAVRCPQAIVRVGGPARDDPGGPFVPGLYVKHGVSISSRGCPNRCPWCFVPRREGKLRLYDIVPGNCVQDNNILAFPKSHFRALCAMLRDQRRIVLVGGLEARRLRCWHLDALRTIERKRFRELWFAADTDDALDDLARVRPMFEPLVEGLAENGRRKLRCYVMIGYRETIEQARRRLENVWDAGYLPFAQLYRDETGGPQWSAEWRALQREWARPAAMFSQHKGSI